MNSKEFAYWLRGFFELNLAVEKDETTEEIKTHVGMMKSPTKLGSLIKHLLLAQTVDINEGRTSSGFVNWLDGYLRMRDYSDISFYDIYERLQKEFKHVIDPSYENQEHLNSIHNPMNHLNSHSTSGGTTLRC